jgi:hypothetical protein
MLRGTTDAFPAAPGSCDLTDMFNYASACDKKCRGPTEQQTVIRVDVRLKYHGDSRCMQLAFWLSRRR